MIASFNDREGEKIFTLQPSRRFAQIQQVILRKLLRLHAAAVLEDLQVPPGHRLEALRGDRKGQHGIRVNDQFRVCFVWKGHDAYDVEIVDYH